MSSFYQMFLAWGILLVVVLSFYLIDKVNTMYRFSVPAEIPKTYSDGLFGELVGKNLWDAMSGIPVQGIDPQLVENLKPHYEPVLRQHIELTFMEGFRDSKAQRAGVPPNNRQIPTPRGSVESWLPLHHLASIYQAGSEFAMGNPDEQLRIQQNLDQVTAMLYARTNLELKDPYSETLLKLPIKEGLMPDPEELPPEAAEVLNLEGPTAVDGSNGLGELGAAVSVEGQNAKMQALSDSLSGFDALGEPLSAEQQALETPSLSPHASGGGVDLPQPPLNAPQAQMV